MTELPSNSYLNKKPVEEQPAVEKHEVTQVAQGKVQKKSWFRNATHDIVNDTSGTGLMRDVIVPAAKKGIYDALSGIVDSIFGGGGRSRDRGSNGPSYQRYYDERNGRSGSTRPMSRATYGFSYQDPIVDTRMEAERVYNQMQSLVQRYGNVSVQDLYEAVGLKTEYTDCNYGWEDLRDMEIRKVSDGWLIAMPRCIPLNK